MSKSESFSPLLTADGSFTFFSPEFAESFHSHFGARQESFLKFAVPTNLTQQAHKTRLRILDICYGLGYNTAAALETIWQSNPNCMVEIIALEIDQRVPQAAIQHHLFDNWSRDVKNIIKQVAFDQKSVTSNANVILSLGDARQTIQQVITSGFSADAIFLDPFSPPRCPQLWTIEFIAMVAKCLGKNGWLATYSCAAAVRTALLNAGLVIGSTPPVGRKTPGTIAAYPQQDLVSLKDHQNQQENHQYMHGQMIDIPNFAIPPIPEEYNLSQSEIEHLHTKAAVPYRDPSLSASPEIIISRRQQEQENSHLEPTSHWRKRWSSG